LRITTVRDMDGALWYIRNGEILQVANHSDEFSVARIQVPVGLSNDTEKAYEVIENSVRAAAKTPEVSGLILDEPVVNGVTDFQPDYLSFRASHVHFFTGAGMSADSGLDTFRDAQTGLWQKVNPQDMASIEAWQRDPDPMWAWYLWRAHLAHQSQPHAGHLAIGSLAQRSSQVSVTTQNIDDLHERSGCSDVAHLHGSLVAFRCSSCHLPYPHHIELPSKPVSRLRPPHCEECGGLIRPGVVWFGESLPQDQWEKAEENMRAADVVVIVGTSGSVWPAAGLPSIAHRAGTPIIEVSPHRSDLTDLATVWIADTAAAALPAILK